MVPVMLPASDSTGMLLSQISASVIPLLIVVKVRLGDFFFVGVLLCFSVLFYLPTVRRGIRRFREDDIITALPSRFKRRTWRPPRPPAEPALSRRKES